MNFAGDNGDSYLTIGGYDVDEFATSDVTWHENIGEHFWATNANGL